MHFRVLEKAMAPHSSALAWKIPWTEEPGGLQSTGSEESDTTERLPFHFSLSCIGEGNGNPPQCSCLETPRDGGAWWAAVYGVTRSQTRLKRRSSSRSSSRVSLTSNTHARTHKHTHTLNQKCLGGGGRGKGTVRSGRGRWAGDKMVPNCRTLRLNLN